MATLPPPYSAKDAAQAQRYYRRSLRRPSIVGPLLLIVVGVLALLVETNQLSVFQFWGWYIRWWPLLLIGVGLISLAEWNWERKQAKLGLPSYAGSHGGLITLIVFLAILGYLVGKTAHGLQGMHLFGHGMDQDDLFSHWIGQEHDDDRSLNRQIPVAALVDIRVPHGDVTVTPSGDDQIHVQAHLVVYTSNDRAARRNLDALAPQLTVNGANVSLRTADAGDGRADVTIEIPKGSVPTITAGHGDVTLEGFSADANVNANRGDVKADNVSGGLRVHMDKGGFNAQAINGDVTLQGRLEDVSITGVQGKVALDGDFFGDTNVSRIASAVHFHSSRTNVELVSLPGDLSIDSGDLQLNNATGPAKISTNAKDIECTGVTSDLSVEDGDGDVSVAAFAPVGELQIHNRNGAINLTVPQGAGFQLQATARNGNIDSKLNLPVTNAGEGQSVSGQVGSGGPRIALVADHGDIAIAATDALPASPPALPNDTKTDTKPMRHLRSAKGADTNPQPVIQ